MNKTRRRKLQELAEEMIIIAEQISAVADEEQDSFDNLPESLKGSEKGTVMEEYVSALSGFADDIENTVSELNDLI